MLDLGDAVEALEGRYVVAEDVGTTTEDMTAVAERTSHVVGLPPERGGSGDPSPVTARGVEAAMRAACERALGSADLADVRVCVIGLGHVGAALAERLADAGARLIVTDIDEPAARAGAAPGRELGGAARRIGAECDVLAPCALGGAIDEPALERLRCAVVCGSANNTLADERPGRGPGRARDPLRARLHRQRRRPDQRLRRAPSASPRPGWTPWWTGSARRWAGCWTRPSAPARPPSTPPAELARRRLRGRPPASEACDTERMSEVWCARLGQVPYEEARALQQRLEQARRLGEVPDLLLLLEHPPVYTKGRRSQRVRAGDGRGLVPDAGDRGLRVRPRRRGHLPRAGPAGRLSDRVAGAASGWASPPTSSGWSG